MNVTIRSYKISLLFMTVLACGLSVYSYAINKRILAINQMLDHEKLKREALLGEKLMIEKALVKANVRLASFENIHDNTAESPGAAKHFTIGDQVPASDSNNVTKK